MGSQAADLRSTFELADAAMPVNVSAGFISIDRFPQDAPTHCLKMWQVSLVRASFFKSLLPRGSWLSRVQPSTTLISYVVVQMKVSATAACSG